MKNKINIDDFLVVLFWVKTFLMFEKKHFDFDLLMEQAMTYKYTDTPLDIRVHSIDDLMIISYQIYKRVERTKDEVSDILDQLNVSVVSKLTMLKQANEFERIFEDLIENYKYNDPEICGIQKGFLVEKMKKYMDNQEYKKAETILENLIDKYDDTEILDIKKDFLVEKMKEYVSNQEYEKADNIFKDLIENYKYDAPEIRNIKKDFLAEKMKEYVSSQEYEKAATVRDIIKEC